MNKETITINGKEITIREPMVRDIRAVSNITNAEQKELALVSNLTGLTQEEIDAIPFKEYKKLQEKLHDFL